MEKKSRKKRPSGIMPDRIKDSAKSGVRRRSPSLDTEKITPPPVTGILDIPLNPETARQAIILSEIIGKPVSKRGRRR